ncbi:MULTISPECIES: CHASE3 domain-containing protein [unclassified Paenibacillus]|uniref:CHASE3 domain-containing protein n=1 Tax=unclassified Paenibacillus TaxID=185978 RepID=UPI001AE24279|nr:MULTISPECIES: CHASE3 domain-containing protein [unclassified Paenibacillus]MBP1153630.1 two-component system chemotaxis sensor kinase CheA [Paenibacillus sp. PvP091]MBP1170985.1 two-component system chemotaxis sensor kinase CheA [Paenibacillus sp. PvR098]MBP2442013.1 two-component system chemotaxis sensor kinase CheA [Paenibacillus sp. PvP052]
MFKLKRTSIRTKIALGYLAILLCLGFSTFVLMDQMYTRQTEIQHMISHDLETNHLSNRIEKHVLDMETGYRGYVLTGNSTYLEPYYKGKQQWLQDYNRLLLLISDDTPSQQQNLEAIKSTIEEWILTSEDPSIALTEQSRIELLNQMYKDDPGKKHMDLLRQQFESLRSIEQERTAARISELESKITLLKTELYLLVLAAIPISIIITFLISNSIVEPIRQVVGTIRSIASSENNLTTRIKVHTKDEIRDLAEVTNLLLDSFEHQNWLKSTIAETATIYQGKVNVTELAQSFLNKLAVLLNATHGVFYIKSGFGEPNKLIKAATYAESGDLPAKNTIWIGEGLVGQAAQEQKVISVPDIPPDYVQISSSFGNAPPRSLLIFPVTFEGEVEAVIELASLKSFTPLQLELLEQIRDSFGIAVHSVAGRMELERLYCESQALTEELQSYSTKLRIQQEALIATNESLRQSEERLQWQKHALEQQAEDLSAMSKYKSEFLANMSHELRTPLNSMLILSQLLADNKEGNLTDKQKEFAQTIYSSGCDLLRLIDEILDLSKVEAGKMELNLELCSLESLTDNLARSFDPVADKKGIRFHIQYGQNVPSEIYTDEYRLQQILRNFLSNAFKFTSKGSVSLRIERMTHIFRNDDEDVIPAIAFSVMDTGIGIPSDKLDLIFEAFRQVDGSTVRKYGGTGLGLTISRELSRLLGGSIRVESSSGAGSRFTLYLPENLKSPIISPNTSESDLEVAASSADNVQSSYLAEVYHTLEETETTADGRENAEHMFADKNVLLVEDDIRNVFALSSVLEKLRMNVIYADNGRDALTQLESLPEIDLILMDIMMPEMGGLETIRQIRSIPEYEQVPIIALSAKVMAEDRQQSLEAGASDYIRKPVDLSKLLSMLARVMN